MTRAPEPAQPAHRACPSPRRPVQAAEMAAEGRQTHGGRARGGAGGAAYARRDDGRHRTVLSANKDVFAAVRSAVRCVPCRAVGVVAGGCRGVPCRAVRAVRGTWCVRAPCSPPGAREQAGVARRTQHYPLLACLIRCTRGHVPLGPSGVGPWPGCSPPRRRAPCAQVPPWRPVRPRPPFHCRAGGRRHDRGRLSQGRRRGLQGGPPRRTP